MVAGFTKLKSSIITSTIWRESPAICKVWITMLALSDSYGIVEGSIPGLADMARVSIQEVEAALDKFRSPDPYSRSKEYDGRRIQDNEGGWLVLNYGKHRGYLTGDDKRAADRIRQQVHRERVLSRDNEIKSVTPDSASVSASQYASVSLEEKSVRKETEDYMAEIRSLPWRDKNAIAAEHEFSNQLSKGCDPAEIARKLEQINVWTEEGSYAPRLSEVIRRWQEPQNLWNPPERRAANGKRSVAEAIRSSLRGGDDENGR